jgi:hypothetical protein
MQSQQVFEPQDMDLSELASFDASLLPFVTYNASDTLLFPIANTETDYIFGDIVSYELS